MRIAILCLLLMAAVLPAHAQDAGVCPMPDAVALSAACTATRLGQACVMNSLTEAQLRSDGQLSVAGDSIFVSDLATVTTQPDELVRLRLPANLDGRGALEGLILGGTVVANQVSAVSSLDAVTADDTRVRSTPDTTSDANIIATLLPGTPLTAAGRDATGDWIRVRYGDSQVGWVASFLVRVSGDAQSLPVGEVDMPVFSPMQSFTVSQNAATGDCSGAQPAGVLLYASAPGTQVTVNGAAVTFDGIMLAEPVEQVGRPAVRLMLFRGRALVQTRQGVAFVVPGASTVVVVSPDLTTPMSAPLDLEPNPAGVDALLATYMPLLAEGAVGELSAPASVADFDAAIGALFAPDGLLPGRYRLSGLTSRAAVPLAGFDCALGSGAVNAVDWSQLVVPQVGMETYFLPDVGDALNAAYGVTIGPDGAAHGAALNEHNNPLYRTPPDTNGENVARTILINSMRSFTYMESWAVHSGGRLAACYNQFTWDWVSP